MEFTAPAKINLYLKVLSKRDDGYHEIETLFERVSLFDRLSVEPSAGGTVITCADPSIPVGNESLLGRTVESFREAVGKDLHFKVKLEKNIPIGAGLGGGSSDAAALLKGMNELSGAPLGRDVLLDISGSLGADIPFFISDCRFAYGRNRGDIIRKIDSSLEISHVLITPPFEVSTREVYDRVSAFGLTKEKGVDTMFTSFLNDDNISGLSENLCNDLQAIALESFPVLKKAFSELENEGALGTLMSGSGPTVFGVFAREKAEKAGEKLRRKFSKKNWRVFVVKTC
ncbi:MAG: 4-(cytidine 5'-diphospho)-2-C-methyl-D-erythritol kinase [Candidatus Omnitrophota bacterium]